MKHHQFARSRTSQQGVAAVEMAIIAPLLLMLLTIPLFFGRCYWHYTAIQKAAHHAALYLSTVPRAEIQNQARAAQAVGVANFIARQEIQDLFPGGDYAPGVTVVCRPASCGQGAVPASVQVTVDVSMFDPFFLIPFFGADTGLLLVAEAEMDYVGS